MILFNSMNIRFTHFIIQVGGRDAIHPFSMAVSQGNVIQTGSPVTMLLSLPLVLPSRYPLLGRLVQQRRQNPP